MAGGGSEVAGCEYSNLRLRFLGGRKRVVGFVQVVLFVGGLIVDTIPPRTNALSRGWKEKEVFIRAMNFHSCPKTRGDMFMHYDEHGHWNFL